MRYTFVVSTDSIEIKVRHGDDLYPAITRITDLRGGAARVDTTDRSLLPLVEFRLAGVGNAGQKTSKSLIGSVPSQRLRYVKHEISDDPQWTKLDVEMVDEESGLIVIAHLWLSKTLPVFRSSATVKNVSKVQSPIITQVSSSTISGVTKGRDWWLDYTMTTATNTWFREAQWTEHSLPSLGIDDFGFFRRKDGPPGGSKALWSLSNRSTWATNGHLPMAILRQKQGKELWVWQVENNGAWRVEAGDCGDAMYFAASGPDGSTADWRIRLAPGEKFTSPWTAVIRIEGAGNVAVGYDEAFDTLTVYRRQIVRPHPDLDTLPIIFNDYMNCLMGDPTEDKINALLESVVKAGAEYYVIDAGWYADNSDWWTDVGEWLPSQKRFPSGFDKLLKNIRSCGLVPGLWLEPEVVGHRSSVAHMLPDDAFFQQGGRRVMEHGRYHLDFRHSQTRKHMDEVVDRLVRQYQVGYFKFDYNVEITHGTEVDCFSPGQGQADHHSAYLAWVVGLLDRYPGLVIENCSSGGQRMEYGSLCVHSIQSTSDQEDPELYAAISAVVPTAVLPEQGAVWAYPQPSWSDEINAYTVANSLLGRIHLSGRLDHLNQTQSSLVHEGMSVYKSIRQDIRRAVPFFPLGLAGWHDDWLVTGLRTPECVCYVTVWRRGGRASTQTIPLKAFAGESDLKIELLYPAKFEATAEWRDGSMEMTLPDHICARLWKITKV